MSDSKWTGQLETAEVMEYLLRRWCEWAMSPGIGVLRKTAKTLLLQAVGILL